jgi:hypothetical protein
MILFEGQIMGENAGEMIWEEREDGKVQAPVEAGK